MYNVFLYIYGKEIFSRDIIFRINKYLRSLRNFENITRYLLFFIPHSIHFPSIILLLLYVNTGKSRTIEIIRKLNSAHRLSRSLSAIPFNSREVLARIVISPSSTQPKQHARRGGRVCSRMASSSQLISDGL